jgi:4-hydroxybenzoyl-CoA thioesterase/acyl-CoA thioester hydrolase
MATPFRTTRLVEFADTDMAGIMHFAAFFRYMESAEHELLRSWGYSIYHLAEGQTISFPRVAASCEYRIPARSEDILQIEVSVVRVGTKSITYHFHFRRDGADLADGEMTCVCCSIGHDQPPQSVPIPENLAQKLRTLAVG